MGPEKERAITITPAHRETRERIPVASAITTPHQGLPPTAMSGRKRNNLRVHHAITTAHLQEATATIRLLPLPDPILQEAVAEAMAAEEDPAVAAEEDKNMNLMHTYVLTTVES